MIRSLKENRDSGDYPFHMPGHKRRLANDEIFEKIYGIDITEIEGFDNLHNASGMIRDAQEKAAGLFGADETHFLVNGSTSGILAAIVGSVTSGDAAVIASNCHGSVYNAVMLSGAKLFVITPEQESLFETSGGISPDSVKEALETVKRSFADSDNEEHRTAVVITSPTYEGITSDVAAIADICHENNAVLIVDAAHGAHLGFSDRFPESAVQYADVVVAGVHKTLPAMTQTALIHIKKECPHKDRIRRMLSVFMTSSPSYVLMASIDSMTDILNEQAKELFEAYAARLDDLYKKAKSFKHLCVLSRESLTAEGSADHDRSKIAVKDMTGKLSGVELSDILHKQYGIRAEMATPTYVLLMTGIADTDEGFDRLINALGKIDEKLSGGKLSEIKQSPSKSRIREIKNDIKSALFSDNKECIPIESAEGRIAADHVTIYPPDIPVVIPGEKITKDALDKILEAKKEGLQIIGLKDEEIEVLWERYST